MSHALRRPVIHGTRAGDGTAQLSFLETETDASLMHRIMLLPKIELHKHLTGSIAAPTAVRIAAKHNIKLPTYIATDLDRVLFSQETVKNHKQYFVPWQILNKLFVSLDAVRELLTDVVRDAASDNVIYTELRLGPRNFLGENGDYNFREFVDTVADSLRDADARYGTITKCVLGIPRHVFAKFPLLSRNKMFGKMLYAIRERPDCFVGVDLNGDELAASATDFVTFFKIARQLNLPVTIHAGEVGPAESVSFAVEELGASRIGHGIAAAKSERTLALLAERRCTLEICPTSNKFLGLIKDIRDLPLRRFQERQIPFVICTDNPARCRTSLSEELYKIAKSFSYSSDDLAKLTAEALAAAFVDDVTRSTLAAKLH
jgi:adenosine deaminase